MHGIHIFDVRPKIPEKLEELRVLAYNIHTCWDHNSQDLFRRIDPDLWDEVHHNPVEMLGQVTQERYRELLEDDGFIEHLNRAMVALQVYLRERSWFGKAHPERSDFSVAYFSAEFGLHECMPVYSGGLGVLAGDHLKSNSDLGIPMIGVGLLYQKGYFQQYLNVDGWQQETYRINDYSNMPVELLKKSNGEPYKIKLDFPEDQVHIQCWKVVVGRVPIYLLDTNLPDNIPLYQVITDELYGGDREKRIQQEIVIGIGGYRMLKELDIHPRVFHINEGHSAFLALERVRNLMLREKLSFSEAAEAAAAGSVFTTHTPVPAGNDWFSLELMEKYFQHYYTSIGLTQDEFMNLGRIHPDKADEGFCMTVLALKLANYRNAVSKLHGSVSRKMWSDLWPQLPEKEIPITAITNGVHPATWISRDMSGLLTRYLGPKWQENPGDAELWKRVDKISDEELWRTHERGREQLVAFARPKLIAQLKNRGASAAEIKDAENALNPETLTIGFARRFATYKRGTLLLRNSERLRRIISDKTRPVQFIFAGKAHPKDEPGKEFIRRIIHFARDPEIRHRVIFLENYDISVARSMVRGVDVWLNTPRRPLEACGTSGMKAALNGALNLSILDGWWCEGYKPNLGWAIGKGEEYDNEELQDDIEANALYNILEQKVIPMFYDEGPSGVPHEWVSYMKESMKALGPVFSTNRMTFEYLEKFYLPAELGSEEMKRDNYQAARKSALWKEKIRKNWTQVQFIEVLSENGEGHQVEDFHRVSVKIKIGRLSPDDLTVELYYGRLNEKREIMEGETLELEFSALEKDGIAIFQGQIPLKSSGRFGFRARALPNKNKMSGYHPVSVLWE